MKVNLKQALLASLLCTSAYTSAKEVDITVNANIDPTVSLAQADGTPMPDSIFMDYSPNEGLKTWTQQVKLYSNDTTKNIDVSLLTAPVIEDISTGNKVNLAVSLKNKKLSTSATSFVYKDIFPNGISTGSVVMPLSISQDTTATKVADVVAGKYTGKISLIIAQGTSVSPSS